MVNGIMPLPRSSDQVIPSIPGVIKSIAECVTYCQKQETVRTEINAKRDFAVAMIRSRQQSLSHLLDRRFDERERLFERYFVVAEKALENGNDEVLKDVLQSILAVYGTEVISGTDSIKGLLDFRPQENAA